MIVELVAKIAKFQIWWNKGILQQKATQTNNNIQTLIEEQNIIMIKVFHE